MKDELESAIEDLIKHNSNLAKGRKVKSVLKRRSMRYDARVGYNPPPKPKSNEWRKACEQEEINERAKKQREKEAIERKNRKRYLRPVE